MATESNDPVYDCFPPGTPRVYFHPFPMEIIQLPGRTLILYEYHHSIRQIYTDGRGHRTDLAPLWMGDSTGYWDGDTLVVETVNFNDKTWLDREGLPHSRWRQTGRREPLIKEKGRGERNRDGISRYRVGDRDLGDLGVHRHPQRWRARSLDPRR